MPQGMTSRSLVPTLAFLVLAGGCDGDREANGGPVRALAGQVDADVYVALVADDHDVVLYACDGTGDRVTVTEWFQGPHDGGHFDLASMRTEAHAEGDFDAEAGEGTLHTGGAELSFVLGAVDGDAGLYFDEVDDGDVGYWGGWIVHRDGSVRGSVLNRKTGGLVAAGEAVPGGRVTVSSLAFDVRRLEAPAL